MLEFYQHNFCQEQFSSRFSSDIILWVTLFKRHFSSIFQAGFCQPHLPPVFYEQHFSSSILPIVFPQHTFARSSFPAAFSPDLFSAAFDNNEGIIAFCQYLLTLIAFDSNKGIIFTNSTFPASFCQHFDSIILPVVFAPSILPAACCQ